MSRPTFNLGSAEPRSLVVTLLGGAALAAFAAHTLKLQMPSKGKIIAATLNVGGVGGVYVTGTLDVQKGGVSLLDAPFNVATITPGTPVLKTSLAAGASPVAQDAELEIVTAENGGTAPTWQDVTVQIDYLPLGG